MPSSMLTSMRFAPPRTCSSATSRRRRVVAGLDQPREPLRAGDVGPLADHLEVAVGPDRQRLEAGELRVTRSGVRSPTAESTAAAAGRSTAVGDRRDVIRRRAAAAADDVDEAAGRRTRAGSAPVSSGCSSYSPNAFGRPAFG